MSNHTKGPWFKGNTSNHEIMILGGASRNYVCHVTIQQTGGGLIAKSMESEREANARLIATAPELLEALKEACDIIKDLAHYANCNGGEIDEEYFQTGLEAIAKAEGTK